MTNLTQLYNEDDVSKPCLCGHYFNMHLTMDNYRCIASMKFNRNGTFYRPCACNKFKLDNLKYLEEKYERSLKPI